MSVREDGLHRPSIPCPPSQKEIDSVREHFIAGVRSAALDAAIENDLIDSIHGWTLDQFVDFWGSFEPKLKEAFAVAKRWPSLTRGMDA